MQIPTRGPATTLVLAVLVARAVDAGGVGEPDLERYRNRLPPVTREYVAEEEMARYDDLLAAFGRNKELPEGYELQALLALSHFPELAEIRIRFVQDDVAIPISSRPRPVSAFRSRRNRLYLVVIDTEREGRTRLLLKNQPFNAQIGILGHELAHTASYVHRSFFGIAGDALCQLSVPCRTRFEHDTDRRLIAHHLGWQRYDHSRFLRSGPPGVGVAGGGSVYLGPTELLEIMHRSGLYRVESYSSTDDGPARPRPESAAASTVPHLARR